MERCQCRTGNKKQCVRDAKNGSQFCWQHQNCQTVQKYTLTKNEIEFISSFDDSLVDLVVGVFDGIIIEHFQYKKRSSTLHAKILIANDYDLGDFQALIESDYFEIFIDNLDSLKESPKRQEKLRKMIENGQLIVKKKILTEKETKSLIDNLYDTETAKEIFEEDFQGHQNTLFIIDKKLEESAP